MTKSNLRSKGFILACNFQGHTPSVGNLGQELEAGTEANGKKYYLLACILHPTLC